MKSNRLINSTFSLTTKKLSAFLLFAVILLSFNSVIKADIYPFNIRVTQPTNENPFDGSFADGTAAAIRFFTPPSTSNFDATVKIYNGATLVKTITADTLNGVDNSIVWDGSTDGSVAAPTGTYTFEVTTTIKTPATTYAKVFDAGDAAAAGLSTRGVTVVKDPTSKNFGYTYSVNGAGSGFWAKGGLSRVAMNGFFAGDSASSTLVATTGEAIPGTTNRRYAPTFDAEGQLYIVSYGEKKILKLNPEVLNVSFYTTDTIPTTGTVKDVIFVGEGAAKKMFVATTKEIFYAEVGNSDVFNGPYTKILNAETGMTFWSLQKDDANGLYVVVRSALANIQDGVFKFDYTSGMTLKTFADTLWGVHFVDGDAVTLDINRHLTNSAADDILYLTVDKAGTGTDLAGLYEISNLSSTPVKSFIFTDPDNNISSSQTEVAVDFGGNLMYFDNTSEQIYVIEAPTSNLTYTIAGLNDIAVTGSGIVTPPMTIAEAKVDANTDFQPDKLGQVVTVIGVVSSINFGGTTSFSYFIQDNEAGINIYKSGVAGGGPVFNIGDRIMVTGTVAFFRGLTELVVANLDVDIALLDAGNTITPIVLTIPQYLANAEQYEGKVVQIKGVGLAPGSAAWPSGSNTSITVWDGLNKTVLFVDKDSDLDNNPAPTFPITFKGIASQYTSSSTVYNDGYQIIPNFYADITANVATPPSPYFSLIEPANNATVPVVNNTETFLMKWHKAIDFNNDNVVYQFIVLPNQFATGALADTTYNLTAAKVLQLMGVNPQITFRWTIKSKGAESTFVTSVDTFTVTFTNNTSTVEDTMSLTHVTGDLQAEIFNMGDFGSYLDADGNPVGAGVSYKGQNGIYCGGVVFGSAAAASVNGSVGSFSISDLQNVSSNFAAGFTSNANFNQITTAIINDGAAPTPYGMDLIQQTLSNTDENTVYLRYGFINKTAAAINDFYAGVFADWDIDAVAYATNKAGYDAERHLIYQYSPTKPYYYGLVALNGATGYKAKISGAAATIRTDGYGYITTIDAVQPTITGDYRCWIGSKVGNITVNDTMWVTFAIVAGDQLIDVTQRAGNAFIKAKSLGWTDIVVGVEDEELSVVPSQFYVEQNYPNPFNPSTSIRFGLPQASTVDLRIYNILGQEVAVLINGQNLSAGTYNHSFDASSLSSGTYIYRLQSGSNVVTKKMMLIK
ncbi:MAG: T9SS type A sorting domain-containing protein [bacterium]